MVLPLDYSYMWSADLNKDSILGWMSPSQCPSPCGCDCNSQAGIPRCIILLIASYQQCGYFSLHAATHVPVCTERDLEIVLARS